jgi:hypothetical protein
MGGPPRPISTAWRPTPVAATASGRSVWAVGILPAAPGRLPVSLPAPGALYGHVSRRSTGFGVLSEAARGRARLYSSASIPAPDAAPPRSEREAVRLLNMLPSHRVGLPLYEFHKPRLSGPDYLLIERRD